MSAGLDLTLQRRRACLWSSATVFQTDRDESLGRASDCSLPRTTAAASRAEGTRSGPVQ